MTKIWSTFSRNFAKLLEDSEGHDLIINVGQEPIIKPFKAHSVILRAHSPYFRRALSKEWAKKEDGKTVFYKPNGEFILNLLTAADELILPEFIDEVQEYLVANRSIWMQENFYHVLDFSFSHDTYKLLQDYCLETICADPPLLFDSDYFYCLDSSILTSLLRRDDLAMDEVDLWNNVIKWGFVQNPTLSDDPTSWTPDFTSTFQKSLADCIPLIRFTLMTREQFREKVWPFKDILPRKMCDDVLWHFLMPEIQPSQFHPRLKTIDSKLITLKHASLIATWIDRKEGKPYKHTDIPYDFTLLMRGSRDGYSQQTLHQRCGGQAKTIMLMKIKSTEEIFGMYISNIWSNTSSVRSHDSFMFSFGEGRDTKDPVLSRVRAAGYDLALSRGQERGMDELEMFKISPKTVFML
ncbi:9946_t:CDS:2 [Cetraspora pellucida]|uniref:9946_t:CDS:1 n=1 Tax=Cetraspora pellucida TaxID=1433469 RepID=A0ACA9KF20_9GLOM|nr:9946_t:CDS:2 [Cetraspora pellucida]